MLSSVRKVLLVAGSQWRFDGSEQHVMQMLCYLSREVVCSGSKVLTLIFIGWVSSSIIDYLCKAATAFCICPKQLVHLLSLTLTCLWRFRYHHTTHCSSMC